MAREPDPPWTTGTIGPDMTVLEAADVMERAHDSKVLVERGGKPIGFLTERDIIRHVLAHGDRPDRVTVWDVLRRGDGEAPAEDPEGPMSFTSEFYQGKCEECGVFGVDLRDRDGLLVCGDCREAPVGAFRY